MRFALAGLLTVALVGCDRDEIRTYTVPKEPPPAMAKGHPDRNATQAEPRLSWTLPQDWREVGPGQMSLASFAITGQKGQRAQVSIAQLARLEGRDVEIINILRQQLGQDPISREEAERQLQPVSVGGEAGNLFELDGVLNNSSEPSRIVTAIVHRPEGSWFYKIAGDRGLVAQEKPKFIQFLGSIHIQLQAGGSSLPDAAGAQAAAGAEGQSKPKWQVPDGWTELPAGQMQVAKFAVPEQGTKRAEVFVSVFPNDTGGTVANVNRWRRQLGLGELQESEAATVVSELDPSNPTAKLVDLSHNNRRLLGAIVPRGGSYWFYKMLGDIEAVTPQRDAFVRFVQSTP